MRSGLITVPAEVRLAIERHAENCYPEECCGLIASDSEGQIRFVYPLSNNDRSPTSFTVSPDESFGAFMHAERNGWTISGSFHSHPKGPDVLSERDVVQAVDPTWIHLLACPSGLKAFRIRDGTSREMDISVTRGTANPIQIAAGILVRDGSVLLCHRSATREFYPDVWDLPGGHVDPGESAARAMAREIQEELSVTVSQPLPPLWKTVHVNNLEVSLFIVTSWTGEPFNSAPEEHDQIRWVKPNELARLKLADDEYRQLLPQAMAQSR